MLTSFNISIASFISDAKPSGVNVEDWQTSSFIDLRAERSGSKSSSPIDGHTSFQAGTIC